MTGNTCLLDPFPTPFSPVIATTSPDFTVVSEDCPPTLPGNTAFGTTCQIQVAFTPKSSGPLSGELTTGSPFARAFLTGTAEYPVACPTSSACGGPYLPPDRVKKCKKPKKKRAGAAAKKCKRKKKPKG